MNRSCSPTSLAPLLSFTALLCFAGCSASDGSSSGASVRDSAGIRIVENVATVDTCAVAETPELDLGLVDGPEELQFYRVFDAATLSDGRIAVVNQGSGQIRIFHPDGSFDRAFGGEGGGPGEFRDVFQLWIGRGDTLIVADYRPWRFSYFTPDGAFVRTVEPTPTYFNPPTSTGVLEDGSFVISDDCCPFSGDEGEWLDLTLHALRHAPDGALIDTLAVLPNGRSGWLDFERRFGGGPLFDTRSHVAAAGSRVFVGRGSTGEIEVYELLPADPAETEAGDVAAAAIDVSRPTGLLRWEGRDPTVTPEDIETYRQETLAENADSDPRFRWSVDALVSDDRPVADRFPAHGSLFVGREGDLWVHDYRRPGEDEPGWLVFDEAGALECRAWLPFENTWDLYEIGPDYVLGKIEDELEVEHVRRFALTRPAR